MASRAWSARGPGGAWRFSWLAGGMIMASDREVAARVEGWLLRRALAGQSVEVTPTGPFREPSMRDPLAVRVALITLYPNAEVDERAPRLDGWADTTPSGPDVVY